MRNTRNTRQPKSLIDELIDLIRKHLRKHHIELSRDQELVLRCLLHSLFPNLTKSTLRTTTMSIAPPPTWPEARN